ncbi:MAG: hypothetical protein IIU65_04370 [Clostridia bacterium]|nr:hypothetical protein [Clostridia bacterium]
MKNKKLFLPTLIIGIAVVAMIVCSLALSIAKKPTVTEGEFPFSITYELNGKTVTIKDVYKTHYVKNDGYVDSKGRVYVGEIGNMGEGNTVYTLKKNSKGRIELWTNFYADYLMGDPEYDYFETEAFEPKILYYDSEEIEYSDEETLSAQGVKLISFEYPEPIVNSLVFSHISIMSSIVVLPCLIISLLALLAIMIFVKKGEDYVRKPIDVVSTIFNFLITFILLPYFTVCAWFLDALGDNGSLFNQIFYFIPAITVLGTAACIALRRKGYKVSALVVEFIGPAIFAVIMIIAAILGL